jgi:hypothetical protein
LVQAFLKKWKEDLDNFPQIDDSGTPDIPNLNISTEGLIKLLKAVNPNKTNGPDNISCRILKEAAESISPYLQLIFIKSITDLNCSFNASAFPLLFSIVSPFTFSVDTPTVSLFLAFTYFQYFFPIR